MVNTLTKVAAGLLVIGSLSLPKPQSDGKTVAKVADAHNNPPKTVTEADYWVPLDNWLKAQGSPLSGKDAYEVGREYGIDPDFLIAVTKAETNLCKTKQRGSTYNCGSVGSYDSTNTTFGASSYRQGFEQIAQTVNGPLLRKYWRVSELSRSHNPYQSPVYASSNGNWYRNVVGTMNALKGKDLTDYEFRR